MGYVGIECDELPLALRLVPLQMPSNLAVPLPEEAKENLRMMIGVLNSGGDALLDAL